MISPLALPQLLNRVLFPKRARSSPVVVIVNAFGGCFYGFPACFIQASPVPPSPKWLLL